MQVKLFVPAETAVLRPRTIVFHISHVMYMGVGAGVGRLVMPECKHSAALKVSWKSPGFFATFLYEPCFLAEHQTPLVCADHFQSCNT